MQISEDAVFWFKQLTTVPNETRLAIHYSNVKECSKCKRLLLHNLMKSLR